MLSCSSGMFSKLVWGCMGSGKLTLGSFYKHGPLREMRVMMMMMFNETKLLYLPHF